ncbi:MAG TPA: ATP-binding protein, partial [Opitutaceae bacterium]|nr:ATP-binding protein [Opitutaceae bacterium]
AEAEKGVLRARDLTQQLLTFAKGGNPLRTTVLLQDVVREVAEFALHGSKTCCEYRIADDLRPANVDKGQIGQVVQNLVINAVQSMQEGGRLVIALSNEQIADGERHSLSGGAYLKIAISDTGTGIAPEHLRHIFDPYFTTKAHGSGLGLATVYSIVRKHQGDIAVESVVGQGTTFQIWLPAAASMPASSEAPAPAPVATQGRILFMDDEEPIRRLATALLKRMGHLVHAVGEGESAVAEYERGVESGAPYDVVILDLTVPGGLGGLDVLRTLRKRYPEVLAIVSSGYSSDPVLADYCSFGFQGMIPKPYKLEDFARVLNEVLGQRK